LTDISYRPLKQIVVRQYVKYRSPGELARTVAIQSGAVQPASLSWVDGIIFKIASPPYVISEALAKEYIEGRLHISIFYADMPIYQPTVQAAEEKVLIPVLNESSNAEAKQIVEWLKKQTAGV